MTIDLDKLNADLLKLDAAQTRAALFDGDTLRPSPSLKAIRIKEISDADLARLIDSAPAAWPALECLIFVRTIPDQAQLDRIAASPLLKTLHLLDWNDDEDPARRQLNALYDDKKGLKAARIALIKRILDPATPPFIAYRLWQIVRSVKMNTKADHESIAGAVGIPKPYPDGDRLITACSRHIIAHLGGRRPLLTNGPTHAEVRGHTLDRPFLWPDPQYTSLDQM